MQFTGIRRVFSTVGSRQYETIGAFWAEMSARYGIGNLMGLGFGWTETTIDYAIALKTGIIDGADFTIELPEEWSEACGRTEKLSALYDEIYRSGSLLYEIEEFDENGGCRIRYCRIRKKSLLQSTDNTRFTLPDSGRYLRSDVPDRITPEDIQWLLERDIRTVIDLRTEAEWQRRPCPLESDARFCYLHLPVTGGSEIPASPEEVAVSYIRMVDTQMERILDAIQNASTNVLYFCSAGKDRTGVVSAMLQRAAGMADGDILDDYERSGANLKEKLEAFAESANIDIQVITPKRIYMERFLQWLDEYRKPGEK